MTRRQTWFTWFVSVSMAMAMANGHGFWAGCAISFFVGMLASAGCLAWFRMQFLERVVNDLLARDEGN